MVNLTIDGRKVQAPEGTTILDAARKAGIALPTLCWLRNVNNIGACRVCVVELKGLDRLAASCNTPVAEGMEVLTNSPKAREARRVNVELILSQHNVNCAACVRSMNCDLQRIANDLGIIQNNYEKQVPPDRWDMRYPLIRHESRCIKCMRCVQICNNIQTVGIWDMVNTGGRTTVGVTHGRRIQDSDCALCGQCITHCPVGALRERDDTDRAFAALADPEKVTVVQIAPAVRAAWGESLGLPREKATVKRLVTALRKMGFNYIFDTSFSADLTIMEEGAEFIEMLREPRKANFPLFTSCCPGWVRFIKSHYPDMLGHMSTAKSPQQMFGAVTKYSLPDILHVDPSKLFCVSIMPCVAKKQECTLPDMKTPGGYPEVDLVLTTREVDRMIRAEHISPMDLEEEDFDEPVGIGSGAGVIFGASGGVMEAALRSVSYLLTGKNPDADAFKGVRGRDGWRDASFDIAGKTVHVAVASGLGNARKLMDAIRSGQEHYHFVEVMACPGGCAGGGGQPINPSRDMTEARGKNLYGLDQCSALRFSHENPSVQELYEHYHGMPMLYHVSHVLHTDHSQWHIPAAPELQEETAPHTL